jgi:Trypsin-like peptidase domain
VAIRNGRESLALALLGASCVLQSCGAPGRPIVQSPIIYGADDRREAFEVTDVVARATIEGSIVALVPRTLARIESGAFAAEAPSLGDRDNLCPGERFAKEPAAAFCSGILVDWDLVLTAGHCVRFLALQDFVVVRGYDYDAPDQLGVSSEDDIRAIDRIASEALDPEGAEPRLDFAWLHLSVPVRPPWRPAPVMTSRSARAVGEPIISIGTAGGVPLKIDDGGRVREARAGSLDYFSADTDTAHGSSGGGAFDPSMNLIGVMVRGETDLVQSAAGCNVLARVADGASADEEFTYVAAAITALCDTGSPSSICRAECGQPCVALPPPVGGCSLAGGASRLSGLALLLILFAARSAPRR